MITGFESFLGRDTRSGSVDELGVGTYRLILDALEQGNWDIAEELIPITLLEAEELHGIFGRWPLEIEGYLRQSEGPSLDLDAALERLQDAIGPWTLDLWDARWLVFVQLTRDAQRLVGAHDARAADVVRLALDSWRVSHDRAVDAIYGLIDICFRLLGEESVPDVWNYLMSDWYDEHCRRLSIDNQAWKESARQLMVAIADGFHAHLTGKDRLGDIEVLHESGRTGFRFAPCGSGGRVLNDGLRTSYPDTDTQYSFAVTTKAHDWSFGKEGVCTYCVHCCLLNMTVPIDRLGYPTRVIEPPIWPSAQDVSECTWWVYEDPSLIPDEVYTNLSRSPINRPNRQTEDR